MALLTFGLSLLMMHIGVYFEDLPNFLRPIFQMVFYASGVFYPLSRSWDAEVVELLLWVNPVALILSEARNALLYNTMCNWLPLGCWALLSVLLIMGSLAMIYRFENEYIKIV